jgi:hypothetical protein
MFAVIGGSFVKKSGDKMSGNLELDGARLILGNPTVTSRGCSLQGFNSTTGSLEIRDKSDSQEGHLIGSYFSQTKDQESNLTDLTGTTQQFDLRTVLFSGGTIGSDGQIRVTAAGRATGAGGTKNVQICLGSGIYVNNTVVSGTVNWWAECIIHNYNAENVQHGSFKFWTGSAWQFSTGIIKAINTASSQYVYCKGQLVNALDHLYLDQFYCELSHNNFP